MPEPDLPSRTFALSIAALPEALRDAVRVAYLLCRIVDTVEDDETLGAPLRTELFDAFDALMVDDGASAEAFERQADATAFLNNNWKVVGIVLAAVVVAAIVFVTVRKDDELPSEPSV